MKKWLKIVLSILIVLLVAGLLVFLISRKEVKSFNDLDKYDEYLSNLRDNSDAHSKLLIFPNKIEKEKVEEFEYLSVEGLFDGYFMIGADQKKYPVPMNYSSKTKLIPGDTLKLKVMPDGKFIYKLIKPADRKHLRAILSRTDDNKFTAVTDEGTVYFLNQAAVTFFKGTPGDELYIIINEKDKGSFAAIEAIIKK